MLRLQKCQCFLLQIQSTMSRFRQTDNIDASLELEFCARNSMHGHMWTITKRRLLMIEGLS
jgi:hypothetical protein